MASKKSRGNYYRKRTEDYFKKLGYQVVKLEINAPLFVRGKVIFRVYDILASDLAIWNAEEFFLVQVKSSINDTKKSTANMKSAAKVEYDKLNLPPTIKRRVVMWKPKQKPVIIDL